MRSGCDRECQLTLDDHSMLKVAFTFLRLGDVKSRPVREGKLFEREGDRTRPERVKCLSDSESGNAV